MRGRSAVFAGLPAVLLVASQAGAPARDVLVASQAGAPARDVARPVAFAVRDEQTGRPVPCRVHLRDQAGRPQRPRPATAPLPFWRDHFACPGDARLDLAPGDYDYEVERRPEYARAVGRFTVADRDKDQDQDQDPLEVRVALRCLADLAREGWWSGELHVHRPVSEMPLLAHGPLWF